LNLLKKEHLRGRGRRLENWESTWATWGDQKTKKSQVHWLIPVISATWKVELGGFRFKTSSSHKTKQNKS
jgi:hypothetical protein